MSAYSWGVVVGSGLTVLLWMRLAHHYRCRDMTVAGATLGAALIVIVALALLVEAVLPLDA